MKYDPKIGTPETEPNEKSKRYTRRDLLKVLGCTAGAAGVAIALKKASSGMVGERPSFSDDTLPPVTTTTTEVTTTVETSTSTTEPIKNTEVYDPLADSIIPKERLIDGLKIGDINVVNPNGESMIAIPAILSVKPNEAAIDPFGNPVLDENGNQLDNYDAQLLRGAVIEVRNRNVNPESTYNDQALPGEEGDVIIFGHRTTKIHPDNNGDGMPDIEAPLQQVFMRINELQVGAVLTLTLDGKVVRYQMVEPVDQNGTQVLDSNGEQIASQVAQIRAQNHEGKKRVKLLACHPPTKKTHRIVAVFEQLI